MKYIYCKWGKDLKGPFRVDHVDLWNGHDAGGYTTVGRYEKLEDAINAAREMTEESYKKYKGDKTGFLSFGEAGLVYDSAGMLAWDGPKEFTEGDGL